MGNMGWIEIALFYAFAIGFGVWQFWKTDRLLKRTKAESAAKAKAAAKAAAAAAAEHEAGSPLV